MWILALIAHTKPNVDWFGKQSEMQNMYYLNIAHCFVIKKQEWQVSQL